MYAGVLGAKVAESLRCWGSRYVVGVVAANVGPVCGYVKYEELRAFLNQTRVLINLLPNTAPNGRNYTANCWINSL